VSDPSEQLVRSLRGVRGASFHLLTPDNQYGSALPDWRDTAVFKLATPRTGTARFGQYLLDVAPGGGTIGVLEAGFEHFAYVLEGRVRLTVDGSGHDLAAEDFAYLPDQSRFAVDTDADGGSRLLWLKRRYEPLADAGRPPPVIGRRADVPTTDLPLRGVARQELLAPDDPRRDFTMSILRFAPGATLANVEIHDEEHGLYLLQGAGLYHLDGSSHQVRRGDFIYMAPYCPQSFAATGDEPAEYLLYKDVFRDGF